MNKVAIRAASRRPAIVEPAQAGLPEVETLRRRLVRLALDVHDGPMQGLTAVGYGLRDLERSLATLPLPDETRETLAGRIGSLVAELVTAESGLRGLITSLEHGTPEIDSLAAIVDGEIDQFTRRSDTVVEVVVDRQFQPDTHSQAIAIQSVLREALNNVTKHSSARQVTVRAQPSPTGILVEVCDDGQGFDPSNVRPGSIGLASMKQRIELLGGEFDLISRPGGPTVVTALLRRWHRQNGS